MPKYDENTILCQYNNNLFKDYIEPTAKYNIKSNVKLNSKVSGIIGS